MEVWGLNSTSLEDLFPTALKKGLKIYQKVSHWMVIAYICAFALTLSEIVVGFFAICSRLGSLATTIVSSLSSLFIFASTLTSTILFATLTGTFNSVLKSYGIKASMGHSTFVATWLAVAFSWAAGFFWLLSVCCCSGRSPYHKNAERGRGLGALTGQRSIPAEKPLYNYERVESPYMSGAQQSGVTRDVPATSPYKNEPYSNDYNHTYHNGYGYAGGPNHHYNENVPMNNLKHASPKRKTAFEPFRQV
ncbi:putative integral membrane protein [Phaeomoniella chlamydospora]|uniref:Putative integral membrane protein n=1 Tax=Phaeomoniella chlamydospora TaxID=158046 RepID=A0A0G2ESH8_PHACM|nr:putative integral membrane protein [Phaeomoniella chlamydospora]